MKTRFYFLFFCAICCAIYQAQTPPAFQWARSLGNPILGPGGDETAKTLAVDSQGNKYIAGTFSGLVDFDPSPNTFTLTGNNNFSSCMFFAKYSNTGALVWVKKVEGADPSQLKLNSLGEILITGTFNSADFDPSANVYSLTCVANSGDIFLASYSGATGAFTWAIGMGGPGYEKGTCLDIDSVNNILVAGFYGNNADFDPSSAQATFTSTPNTDLFFAKYSPSGSYLWAKTLNGWGTEDCNDIGIDANGDIILTGAFDSNNQLDFDPSVATGTVATLFQNCNNIYIAKYDGLGNYLWAVPLCGDNGGQSGNSVTTDAANNIYITGSFYSTVEFDPSPATYSLSSYGCTNDVFFAKYNSAGTFVFAKQLNGGGSDSGLGIELDALGDIYITGVVAGAVDYDPSNNNVFLFPPNAGMSDGFVAHYTNSGNYVWAVPFGELGTDKSCALAVQPAGFVSCTGVFQKTVDFDGSVNTFTLLSQNGDAFFLADYNCTNGALVNAIASTDYPGSQSDCFIAADAFGNTYLAGHFFAIVDFDPAATVNYTLNAPNEYDLFLAKYLPNGSLAWVKQFGGWQTTDYMRGIVIDNSGNIILRGMFTGSMDIDPSSNTVVLTQYPSADFIAKFDPSGNYIWGFKLPNAVIPPGNAMVCDANDNIYATGAFAPVTDFDPSAGTATLSSTNGGTDAFVVKYNTSGAYVNAFAISGTMYEGGTSIAVNSSGDIFITGRFNSATADFDPTTAVAAVAGNGNMDIFLAKYSNAGTYQFAYAFGSPQYDSGSSLVADNNDDLYMAVQFSGSVDFDPSPGTITLATASQNAALLKYTPAGALQWGFQIGGQSSDDISTLQTDAMNNVYAAGLFSGPADFDPSPATAIVNSTNFQDMFLAKYSPQGNYVWAEGFGGAGSDKINSISLDGTGNVFTSGAFSSQADFDPSAVSYTLSADGTYQNSFFAKYNMGTTVGLQEKTLAQDAAVFPNPVTNKVFIKNGINNNCQVIISNSSGYEVARMERANLLSGIDVSFLSSGLYCLQVLNPGTMERRVYKFIKD